MHSWMTQSGWKYLVEYSQVRKGRVDSDNLSGLDSPTRLPFNSQSNRSLDSQSSLDSLPPRRLAADSQLDSQPGP